MLLQVICFSRNRPLQLHGYLRSLYTSCMEPDRLSVSVVERPDAAYEPAYAQVRAAFPNVTFVAEYDLVQDVRGLLRPEAELVTFGCDDAVFVQPFALSPIVRAFHYLPLLGFSLRLGRNVTRSMFHGAQPQPELVYHTDAGFIAWSLMNGCGDWAYPWELDGTVYQTSFVHDVLASLDGHSLVHTPNQLEAFGANTWRAHTTRRIMAAFDRSVLVVPTVNVVQRDFPNGIAGDRPLSTELLTVAWHAGLRMDLAQFANAAPYAQIHVPDFYLRRGEAC